MIRLHHCPQTRSMRSLWLLHELGAAFEVETYPFDKSLRSPAHLARSPAGRVPALEIDGTVLFETGAIAEYLCERFSEAGLGRMPGTAERAAFLSWLHFAETVTVHVAALTQQHIMLYEDAMRSPVIMKLEAARLGKCFEALDRHLSDQEMMLAGGFSAADIGIAQALYMGQHFVKLSGFAALNAWYGRVTARAGFAASLPQEGEPRLYTRDFYPAWAP